MRVNMNNHKEKDIICEECLNYQKLLSSCIHLINKFKKEKNEKKHRHI